MAGFSVALVLVPQSLAYAELAGLPGVHGLYASAGPLILAALFASCPYLQTGPVALTALLTYGALVPLAGVGTPRYIGAAALLALVVGITRVGIGLLKSGWVSYLMSRPVLRGFTSGAAVLIVMSQIPGSVGVRSPVGGPVQGFLAAVSNPAAWDGTAVTLALMTLVVIVLSRRVHPLLPGPLLAVLAGLAYSAQAGYDGPTVGPVLASFPPISFALPWSMAPQLLLPGIVIALVGFAESAAIAQTYATREGARWDPDREFLSQGAANVVAGLFGGFPVGGSFSRSNLNRLSGAVTRWSGGVTGLAVLLFLPLTGFLAPLPKAVLAGIVIAAVVGLIRPGELVSYWRLSKPQALVAWTTCALCIVLSPRIEQAVLLGILISLATHVWRERKAAFVAAIGGGVLRIEATGVLWFASAPRLEEQILSHLAEAEDVRAVVIDLGGLGRIDLTGALVLRRILEEVGAAGIEGSVENVPPHSKRILDRVLDTPISQETDSPSAGWESRW